jgi:hypothetical protein
MAPALALRMDHTLHHIPTSDPLDQVAIENVSAAMNQIAQTTLRAVVGRHTLDETLSETRRRRVSGDVAGGDGAGAPGPPRPSARRPGRARRRSSFAR